MDKEEIIKRAKEAIQWIKEYVDNSHTKGIIIGNSGGKDSATVIAMAVKALREKTCSGSNTAL